MVMLTLTSWPTWACLCAPSGSAILSPAEGATEAPSNMRITVQYEGAPPNPDSIRFFVNQEEHDEADWRQQGEQDWGVIVIDPPELEVGDELRIVGHGGRVLRALDIGEPDTQPPSWSGTTNVESHRSDGSCGEFRWHLISLEGVVDDQHAPSTVVELTPTRGGRTHRGVRKEVFVSWLEDCGGDQALATSFHQNFDVRLVDMAGNVFEAESTTSTRSCSCNNPPQRFPMSWVASMFRRRPHGP